MISVLPDSPAEKAGIHSGDIFESIGGFTTRDMSVGQALNLLNGQAWGLAQSASSVAAKPIPIPSKSFDKSSRPQKL